MGQPIQTLVLSNCGATHISNSYKAPCPRSGVNGAYCKKDRSRGCLKCRFDSCIPQMVDFVRNKGRQGGVFGLALQRLNSMEVASYGGQPNRRKN